MCRTLPGQANVGAQWADCAVRQLAVWIPWGEGWCSEWHQSGWQCSKTWARRGGLGRGDANTDGKVAMLLPWASHVWENVTTTCRNNDNNAQAGDLWGLGIYLLFFPMLFVLLITLAMSFSGKNPRLGVRTAGCSLWLATNELVWGKPLTLKNCYSVHCPRVV